MKFNNLYCFEYKDIYNICNRIKKINPDYTLFYNEKAECFIIVNIANNHEICLSFYNLNINIENILHFTNIKNFEVINKIIDKHNNDLIKNNQNNFKSKTIDQLLEIRNICNKTKNLSNLNMNKIIGDNNA